MQAEYLTVIMYQAKRCHVTYSRSFGTDCRTKIHTTQERRSSESLRGE